MGRIKAWLMDMEEDATMLSADQFKKQHGEKHMDIWEKINGQETPPEKLKIICHHKTVLMEKLDGESILVCERCKEDVTGEVIG